MAETRAHASGGEHGERPALTVDLDAWPLSLDPYHVVDFNQALVLDALVDPLTREDPHDSPVTRPSAVERTECLDDGRTWRLTPAPGQFWDDGSAVLAREIAEGIHRAWGPTCLPVPAEYDAGGTGSPVTAEVLTDTADGTAPRDVVEVRSVIPLPYLPQLLAFPGAAPVREVGDGWTASGPYRPVRADRRLGRIELLRKAARRTDGDTPERLVFQVHDDRADALAAHADGRLDLSVNTGLTPDEFTEVAALPRATVRALTMACQLWVRPGIDSVLNTANGRRTFSEGFDRDAASAQLQGAVLPLYLYSGLWEPRPTESEASTRGDVTDGSGPSGPLPPRSRRAELTLTYADFPPNNAAATLVAADLQARFGHPIRLRPLPYVEFFAAVGALDYELLYCINPAPLAHVAGYLTQFHSATLNGRALGLRSAAVDAAIDRALRTAGPEPSARAWRDTETTVLDHAPVVPLFQVNSVTLHGPGLTRPAVPATGAVALEDLCRPTAPALHEGRPCPHDAHHHP